MTSSARYCKEGEFEASPLALAHVLLGPAGEGKDLVQALVKRLSFSCGSSDDTVVDDLDEASTCIGP